jgi:hypothetical protein
MLMKFKDSPHLEDSEIENLFSMILSTEYRHMNESHLNQLKSLSLPKKLDMIHQMLVLWNAFLLVEYGRGKGFNGKITRILR